MLKRLGVLGWPVAHSRSPAMQNAALQALGLAGEWRYQALPVTPDLLADLVAGLPGAGFFAVNVTVPHKEAALALATEATPRARAIGAANTLSFGPAGVVEADNTDAPGLIAALAALGLTPRTALVLGAGGSARACAWALHENGVQVRVFNRTGARAHTLAADLGVAVARTSDEPADLLVNCTTVGLHDPDALAVEPAPFGAVVDLVYRPGETALVRAARAAGLTTIDGLEILVRQGALSLEQWVGRPAPLDVMRAAVAGDG